MRRLILAAKHNQQQLKVFEDGRVTKVTTIAIYIYIYNDQPSLFFGAG